MWVSGVSIPGFIDIGLLNGPWDESNLTHRDAPGLGELIGSVELTDADRSRFMTVDVTAAVKWWLDGEIENHGLFLLSDQAKVNFDSKENILSSHPMEIEVTLLSAAQNTGSSNSEPTNPVGIPGPVGPTGPVGPQGDPGPAGATGATDAEGPLGATGAMGPAGPTGPAGTAARLEVELSWDSSVPFGAVNGVRNIDLAALADFCGDVDGCTVTTSMNNYAHGQSFSTAPASNGPFAFFYDPVNNTHRVAEGAGTSATRLDGASSSVDHVLVLQDCYFTDGEFAPGEGAGTDNVPGFQLMSNGAIFVSNGCVLIIKD